MPDLTQVPEEARWRRQRDVARVCLTAGLLLTSAALALGIGAAAYGAERVNALEAVGAGTLVLLVGLWCPWALFRVLGASLFLAACVVGALALLFVAVGGPDSRGDKIPAAVAVLLAVLVVPVAVMGALIQAEWALWRASGARKDAPAG